MVRESVDLLELLRKQAAGGDLDFLREAVAVLAEAVMEAEVAAQIGAGHGERSPERTTWRHGYRPRRWDTRAGSIELQIPKLRQGSYFPALLEPRRRAERALLSVVQQAYVEGVSTRRVDDAAETDQSAAGRKATVAAYQGRGAMRRIGAGAARRLISPPQNVRGVTLATGSPLIRRSAPRGSVIRVTSSRGVPKSAEAAGGDDAAHDLRAAVGGRGARPRRSCAIRRSRAASAHSQSRGSVRTARRSASGWSPT